MKNLAATLFGWDNHIHTEDMLEAIHSTKQGIRSSE